MASLFGDSPPLCPKCGIETAVPVFFGTPSREMLLAVPVMALNSKAGSARLVRAGAIFKAPLASQAPL